MTERVFTQTYGVVAAIIERDGKYLLVKEKRDNYPHSVEDGQWNHPAGWIEVGENPHETVKREVKEETGYDFEPTHVLGVYSLVKKEMAEHVGNPQHAIKIVFTGEIHGEPDEPAEDVAETKWFTADEIEAMDIDTLRDLDIKEMVDDYEELERHPLGVLEHMVSGEDQ